MGRTWATALPDTDFSLVRLRIFRLRQLAISPSCVQLGSDRSALISPVVVAQRQNPNSSDRGMPDVLVNESSIRREPNGGFGRCLQPKRISLVGSVGMCLRLCSYCLCFSKPNPGVELLRQFGLEIV